MSPEEFLMKELTEKLAQHISGSHFDFAFLQFLMWSSILSSAAAAFLSGMANRRKWLIAGIALVPALAITAESSFSFSGRYKYHDEYVVGLETMQRRLKVEKVRGTAPKLFHFQQFKVMPNISLR